MELIKNDAGFAKTEMEVNEKKDGAYVPVGKVTYYVPLLEVFGITAEIKEVGEDGLPVYADENQQYLFDSIHAAVKAKVRNSLVSRTADLKPGLSIPQTMDDLLADRRGAGEGLAIVRELRALFASHVATLGKSAKQQDALKTLFGNRQALSLQSATNKQKMLAYVSSFAETLEADMLEKGARYLQSIEEACTADMDEEELL